MSQPPVRHCPSCGTEASVDQRFCSGCGSALDRDLTTPTAFSDPGLIPAVPPPPPDVDQYATFRQQSTPPTTSGPSYHSQPTEGSFPQPSPYAIRTVCEIPRRSR